MRTALATWLVATGGGCGLDLNGEAYSYQGEATPSAGDETALSPSESSGEAGASGEADASDDGADGTLIDQEAPSGQGDAAIGAGDTGAIGTLAEAGPSHGTMSCPADSDAAVCDLSTSVCCTCPGCFAPYPTGCFPTLTGCVGVVFTGVYARLTCGDATNCETGSTCCAQFDPTGALTGSSCLPSCPAAGSAQLCTVNAPCGAGASCRPLPSAPDFSTCQ